MNVAQLRKRAEAVAALIEAAKTELDTLREDVQTWIDDRSERWQESEASADWDDRMAALESAMDSMDESQEYLGEVQ